MVPRRLVAVLLLLVVAGLAAAQERGPDAVARPEAQASCWDCHNVAQGQSGPLGTFVNLVPADGAGGGLGQAFDFTVQVQNAWSAQLRTTRLTLDLTQAPSLGFAADVPPVDEAVDALIPFDLTKVNEPQGQAVTVFIPNGETKLDVVLTPNAGTTGSDLALLVYPPTYPLNGPPFHTSDNPGQGVPEEFHVTDRAQFGTLGYGNWTFIAQARFVPAAGGGLVVPTADGIPFHLEVDAIAEDTGERIGSVFTQTPIEKGGSLPLTFRLVGLGEPGEGETVGLATDVWAHYIHVADRDEEVDDENLTKVHPAVLVANEGGQPTLRQEAGTSTVVFTPQNGATLATVSEAIGYGAALLLVSSVATGGMFGKGSRRALNTLFGAAKRRVAFHNFLSYGILLFAAAHTVLFILEAAYDWKIGLLWGGLAVLSMLGLGLTGAIQVQIIRAWSYNAWRWTHYGLAVAAIVFSVVHGVLDGAHFTNVQDAVGWRDPVANL